MFLNVHCLQYKLTESEISWVVHWHPAGVKVPCVLVYGVINKLIRFGYTVFVCPCGPGFLFFFISFLFVLGGWSGGKMLG